jgi:hypothetical protein
MQSMFVLIYDYLYDLIFVSIDYFACPGQGAFPDTAQCAIGRYFYCSQASAGKYLKEILLKN